MITGQPFEMSGIPRRAYKPGLLRRKHFNGSAGGDGSLRRAGERRRAGFWHSAARLRRGRFAAAVPFAIGSAGGCKYFGAANRPARAVVC